MYSQMLTTLSRGKGRNGQAIDDYKLKYPKEIPYFLREVSNNPNDFPPAKNESKFRRLPGTYMTEKGQMILYTRAKKCKGIEKEIADSCNKLSDFYDIVQTIKDEFRRYDVRCAKHNSNIGDIHAALGSLKNNWYFPKKWNSPGKEFVPREASLLGYDIKDFLKNRKATSYENIYNIKNEGRIEKVNSISLPEIYSKSNSLIALQEQNNATDSNSYSSNDITIIQQSASAEDLINDSLSGDQSPLCSFNGSELSSTFDSFYDVEEEFIIQRNILKKEFHYLNDKDLFIDDNLKFEIADVMGGDAILSDIKPRDLNLINLRQSKTIKNEKNEELRMVLLKDLYEKSNFLSLVKQQLKVNSESLLHQFQQYNLENRKLRITNKKKELHKIIQDMKKRNDEIRLRLQKTSEQKILEKKEKIDKSSFIKEWDNMLLELSRKSKLDIKLLESKKVKLVDEEEMKIKILENEKLEVEHASIIFAFATLKSEFVKIEEEKHDIEHFIIRLEMGRENVLKIEKDMSTKTPPPFKLNKNNFPSYFKKIKEDTILNWQFKMRDLGSDFKVEESKFADMLISVPLTHKCTKEKGDIKSKAEDSNLNATDLADFEESKKISSETEVENLSSEINKSESLSRSQKNYAMKLDYEMIKIDQKISANHTYSYFVPWSRENYERNIITSSTLSESDEEAVKQKKAHKLNYKRILAHNPLKERRRRKCRKQNLKF